MAKAKKSVVKSQSQKEIDSYEHYGSDRVSIPQVGLVKPETDPDTGKKKKYAYDPHLDPQLQWAGKTEHTSFEVPTASLHIHERIDPRRIVESVRAKENSPQLSLFENEKKPLREAIEFYKHKENWSNRLIAGDSLLVMNSLLEKEGMAGKVQMVYFDPPYGIKYGSNFQPFTNKRDVKDGSDHDLSSEPEMLKAFRDTWELGIHSYLTYIRDRLLLAKELLNETGSVFVQIGDENVHKVRALLDEIFGAEQCVSQIVVKKTLGLGSSTLSGTMDYILWYSKDISRRKTRTIFTDRIIGEGTGYWKFHSN
jgi:adenine-specific DNA-methyltransferase